MFPGCRNRRWGVARLGLALAVVAGISLAGSGLGGLVAQAGDELAQALPVYMPHQQLMVEDGAAEDLFGAKVAWDGTTLAVGVPSHAVDEDTNKGIVTVYRWDGKQFGAPVEVGTPDDTDDFGRAVAIQGDTLAISARTRSQPNQPLTAFYAVYVYQFDGSAWVQQARLTSDDIYQSTNNFGYDLALDGDRLAVGASDAAIDSKARRGSVHLFTRSAGAWTREAILTASDGQAQQYFGRSVALQGDRLVAGTSPVLDASAAAYFFERDAGTWVERQIIPDPNPQAHRFGETLALDGDTLAVSDRQDFTNDDESDDHCGTVYVFTYAGDKWVLQAEVGAGTNLDFGRSVALAGNLLLAGAPVTRGAGPGAAHLYMRVGDVWMWRGELVAEDEDGTANHFGDAVGLAGDALIVGAPYKSTADGKWIGAAYVYNVADDAIYLPAISP